MSMPAKEDYTVGWICALPSEMAAAKGMLDVVHPDLQEQDPSDHNSYCLGQVHSHNMHQGVGADCLYQAEYEHPDTNPTCEHCDSSRMVKREVREDSEPQIHYGNIASGNQVIKHAATRDRLRKKLNVLCFEMEAAGLIDFPCLVIRGVCDYADSHKNKKWQEYAAATAAAFAKEILSVLSVERVQQEKAIQVSDHVLQQIASRIDTNITQHTQRQDYRYKSERQRACHRVFKTSMYEQFKNINPNRVPGTCKWVLEHPQYLQWCKSRRNDLLWISADPGCGKSVLSKSLIDNELKSTNTQTVCYFFFKDNEEQNNLSTALCALLHQLFDSRPLLLQHALPAYEKDGEQLQREIEELWRILLAAAADQDAGDIICVLDALDECEPQHRRVLLQNLSSFYAQSSSHVKSNGFLKFLVTSRPYDDIELGFMHIPPSLPTIRLWGEMENDKIHQEIDLVIRQRVATLAQDNRLDPRTQEALKQRLLAMEHRTYLWLYLAFEAIYDTYRNSLRPDEESIESLPSSVEDAYEKLLSKVQVQHRQTATTLLHIIVGARRPLTTAEAAVAFTIHEFPDTKVFKDLRVDQDRFERLVRHLCGLFIFINHSRIYLIHQTAREFLVMRGGVHQSLTEWKHCLDPTESERIMTCLCVAYLSLHDFEPSGKRKRKRQTDDEDLTQEMPVRIDVTQEKRDICDVDPKIFLDYSAQHWPAHYRDAHIDTGVSEELMTKVCRLYRTDEEHYMFWFDILLRTERHPPVPPPMNSLHLAAYNGHDAVLEIFLDSELVDVNAEDGGGFTALYWAADQGYEAAIRVLLKRGAEINIPYTYWSTILQKASARGHEKIVQLLLDRDADVNIQSGYNNATALIAASEGGYEKIVQLLLDRGADVNIQDKWNDTALHSALLQGKAKIVQLLLDRGADVNIQNGFGQTALRSALLQEDAKIVQLLYDRGAR